MNVIPKKSVLAGFSILLILSLVFATSFVSIFRTHNANMIKLQVEGSEMSLQDAVNGGFLVDTSAEVVLDSNSIFNLGHNLQEVFVSVDGVEMSLQDAVESKNLCASSDSSYESEIEFGHNANEIFVTVDGEILSLQDSINRGDYCCVPEYNLDSSGCKYYSSCDGSFYENAADGTSCGDYMECNSGVCETTISCQQVSMSIKKGSQWGARSFVTMWYNDAAYVAGASYRSACYLAFYEKSTGWRFSYINGRTYCSTAWGGTTWTVAYEGLVSGGAANPWKCIGGSNNGKYYLSESRCNSYCFS